MNAVFVDTMAWFSLLNSRDAWHEQAVKKMRQLEKKRVPLVTTDYVANETATLLKVRGAGKSLLAFFDILDHSRALTTTSIDQSRFAGARKYFIRHLDHGYSFTDVTSFVVMAELGLTQAFTHDKHFEEAGFERLLREP